MTALTRYTFALLLIAAALFALVVQFDINQIQKLADVIRVR